MLRAEMLAAIHFCTTRRMRASIAAKARWYGTTSSLELAACSHSASAPPLATRYSLGPTSFSRSSL